LILRLGDVSAVHFQRDFHTLASGTTRILCSTKRRGLVSITY
jgi:hypothetical protein